MKDKKFLMEFLNTPSPVMYEYRAQKVWAEYIKPFVDEVVDDNYGNVYGIIRSNRISKTTPFKVVIDAHVDEISYVVNHISDEGLIHPIRNGGSDIQLALSKDVTILTKDGNVDGVFGWIPVHNKVEKLVDVKPEKDNLFIDIGANTKDAVLAMGVKIGDPIIYKVEARMLNSTDKLVGKSLDDKIGCYINAMVIEKLYKNKIRLPYDLYILNSVQEEVGAFGAKIAISNIKPDVALVFDVFFDSTNPLFPNKKMIGSDAKLGDGAIIMNSTCVQKNLYKLLVDTAEKNKIKYKLAHSTGMGGTNADKIFVEGGIATALISIPLKYMHTTVEMVDMKDVSESIDLIYESLQMIENNHDFRYLKL